MSVKRTVGVLFLVEGPSEASIEEVARAGEDVEVWKGAVPPLLQRLLEAEGTTVFIDAAGSKVYRWKDIHKSIRLMRGRKHSGQRFRSKLAHKTFVALQKYRLKDGWEAIVALWDTDGKKVRLDARDEVNSALDQEEIDGVAVGVYERQLEAWLLVDKHAFRGAFGCEGGVEELPKRPEQRSDVKKTLLRALESCNQSTASSDMSEHYHRLATHISLDELKRKCPQGFGHFAGEVGNRLAVSLQR